MRQAVAAVVVIGFFVVGCDDGGSPSTGSAVTVAGGATFCEVFDGQYRAAMAAAVPVTDNAFDAQASEIIAWAKVLEDLAPPEVLDLAQDNLAYHQAQADLRSAAEFIPGSNSMHSWAQTNC